MNRELWRETPAGVKLLLTTSFLMNMGFYALIPYLTLHLTGSVGWTLAMAGLVLSVRQFAQQGFAFLGGIVADMFGYKGTMVLGVFIRAIGFASFAICTETWHFFAAAILSGLGGALFDPAGSAAYAILTPQSIRKDIFAFRNVLTNIGIVGSQLVGSALSVFDFAWLSVFAGGLFFLTALLVFLYLPPLAVQSTRTSIWKSMALVLHDKPFLHYTMVLVGYYYLYMQLFLSIPQMAEDVLGNHGAVGIVLATVSASIVLLQMPIMRWTQGYTQRLTLIGLGAFVMGAGLFLFSFANSLWMLLLDAFLFAVGTMISMPHIVDMVPLFAPREQVGAYYGFNSYSLAIGGGVGTIAGGWAYDLGQQWSTPWLPWTLCLLVGVLVFWQLYRMDGKVRYRVPEQSI